MKAVTLALAVVFASVAFAESDFQVKGTTVRTKALKTCEEKANWFRESSADQYLVHYGCLEKTGTADGYSLTHREKTICDGNPRSELTTQWDCSFYPEKPGVATLAGTCFVQTPNAKVKSHKFDLAVDSEQQIALYGFYRDAAETQNYSVAVENRYKTRKNSLVKLDVLYHPPFANPGEAPELPVDPNPVFLHTEAVAADGAKVTLSGGTRDLHVNCKATLSVKAR